MTIGVLTATRRATLLAILVSLAAMAAGWAVREPAGDHDRFYSVIMEGARAGWMRSTQTRADGVVTTTRRMKFEVRRGQARSTSSLTTRFVESADGTPVSMIATHEIGAAPVTVEYQFKDGRIEAVSDQRTERTLIDAPKEAWLPPAAAATYLRHRLAARAGEISYRTMDPLTGPQVVTVTHSGIRPVTRRIEDRNIEGFLMETTASNAPGTVSIDFVDSEGNPVTQKATLGGLAVEFVLSGPEVVSLESDAPELLVSTFVKPDRRISDPRRATEAVYVLDFGSGPAPPIPETGSQSVVSTDGARVTISVNVASPNPAPEQDTENREYLDPSAMVASRDPLVREIAERAVRDIPAGETRARAAALMKAVDRHISKKTLDVGFAGAAETARRREGDCTEHAVLLAAVLRSIGIPSRVAGGLLYVSEFAGVRHVFGYHLWTQALLTVDGTTRWIDLDATLSSGVGFDATHVCLTASPLTDDRGMLDLLGLAHAMGRLGITVVAVDHRR